MSLEQHLIRQIAFSRATFGPGTRTEGVIDHIRKELVEIEAADPGIDRAREWADVVLLGLDGLWREVGYGLSSCNPLTENCARNAAFHVLDKQARNELRNWPDWRTADPTKAIEHVKTEG